mgnify:CR=1 FL=1
MKKLFIETYGCQMNVADSEVVASIMQMAGYELCENEAEADAIFLNTCSIRENAENKIYGRLETLHAEKKKGRQLILGVLGCMAERVREDLIQNHFANLVCGPDSYLNLPDMIAQCENGQNAMNIELSTTETYRDVVPQRIGGNRVSGFVSIMRGCNNFCHYCIVPYTRGRERSRDAESILREVRDLQQRGFKEVTLLGQNVNSYGLSPSGKREEGSLSFAELLHMVAQAVPDMRVRFTTSNPEDMTEDILHAVAEEPNLCKHIHFPAQSGSTKILKLMNRKYTREQYLERVEAIRRIIPGCGLSTDLFVGYHDETPEDHAETLSLVRECQFDSAFMFKYRAPQRAYKPSDGGERRAEPQGHRQDIRGARRGLLEAFARAAHGTHRAEQGCGVRQRHVPHRRPRDGEDYGRYIGYAAGHYSRINVACREQRIIYSRQLIYRKTTHNRITI